MTQNLNYPITFSELFQSLFLNKLMIFFPDVRSHIDAMRYSILICKACLKIFSLFLVSFVAYRMTRLSEIIQTAVGFITRLMVHKYILRIN
jgi:hypothetical protein